jgi:hypothetical protein
MIAKTAETAKTAESIPVSRATPVDKAVTAAEWELGIPPVLVSRDQSSLLVAIYWIGTFTNCAKKMAASEAHNGKFVNNSIAVPPKIYKVPLLSNTQDILNHYSKGLSFDNIVLTGLNGVKKIDGLSG